MVNMRLKKFVADLTLENKTIRLKIKINRTFRSIMDNLCLKLEVKVCTATSARKMQATQARCAVLDTRLTSL